MTQKFFAAVAMTGQDEDFNIKGVFTLKKDAEQFFEELEDSRGGAVLEYAMPQILHQLVNDRLQGIANALKPLIDKEFPNE